MSDRVLAGPRRWQQQTEQLEERSSFVQTQLLCSWRPHRCYCLQTGSPSGTESESKKKGRGDGRKMPEVSMAGKLLHTFSPAVLVSFCELDTNLSHLMGGNLSLESKPVGSVPS